MCTCVCIYNEVECARSECNAKRGPARQRIERQRRKDTEQNISASIVRNILHNVSAVLH